MSGSEKIDQVIHGLEKLANAEGHKLEINVHRPQGTWVITFKAGQAMVSTRVLSFAVAPRIVLEPFCEELCKQIRGDL